MIDEKNVIETIVIPSSPRTTPGEQLYVYLPIVTADSPGISMYDPEYFEVLNGVVKVSAAYFRLIIERLKDELSPTIDVETISNGHRVIITDINSTKSFNVLNGEKGDKGDNGDKGDTGTRGSLWYAGAAIPTFTANVHDKYVITSGADIGTVYTYTESGWSRTGSIRGPQGERGDRGDPFAIVKIYSSVDEMNADFFGTDVKLGQFVLINTGNVDDADNAKLYVKGPTSYVYITDLSGAQGISGPQGERGEKGEKGDDYILTEEDMAIISANATPPVTEVDDGKILAVENGKWVAKFVHISGGGGGSSNNAVLTMTNTTGWLSKSIAENADCDISFTWSSVEEGLSTGNGILKITVDNVVKTSYEVEQGAVIVNVGKYLKSGTNIVKIEVSDIYGNTKLITYSINSIAVSVSSYFDGTVAYTGPISYSYVPSGAIEKTVHFVVDGTEIDTKVVTASNREQSFTIPAQAHGSHTFEVYFTCTIDGHTIESNRLYYDLICYEAGNATPIISIPFKLSTVKQYTTVPIPYSVYTPNILTSDITLKNGDETVTNLTVDRTQQIWSFKTLVHGNMSLSIVCGDVVKPITFTVTENKIDVAAETENLELYLTSAGRSNNEENPLTWSYNDTNVEFTNFNLTSDGWQLDEDKNTALRVAGDARVYIPFNIFGSDFRTTGKTVEIEFATRDVLNYDAVILSSWSGERGIKITAQKALLKSEESEIFTQYKENETVRIAFSVEKRAENRLLAIYINGIMSGVVQYPAEDDFSQTSPVGISIGSNDCTTDIYCIRVYSNNLTRYQILDNWIADTQNVDDMVERYSRNNIFDDYGDIVVSKLPSYLPYMVINVSKYSDLPQSKGDKKTVSGRYVDTLHPERAFTFTGAEIDVQGTSSQYYSRKNYKIKFNNGLIVNGMETENYRLRSTSMPTNEFTFKADVASSEGANNVELVRLYDDTCPVKTPPQRDDSRVRQGIEGYPCLMFYGDGETLNFLGKYNFNNDKATGEVFGFNEGDESWEILQNNTDMVIWKDDNFTGDAWKTSFEARYPEDSTDTAKLNEFASWLKSTDTTAVTDEAEKQARIDKFKTEFANYANVDAMLFNYIFTEMFLMVDNRAKNAFPTRYSEDGKWLILPYDYDTAIGINNEGELKFGYELEDTDLVNGNNVYNGQDSVLYVNMRLAFADEIMQMYKDLRTGDIFSYEEIEKRFEEHQSVWGEAVFNEDARFKYIEPLIDENNKTYLPMLQGAKAEQRKWWLYNRFRYLDSKYNAGDALEDYIMLRSYAVADIEVTPYADIYASAKFDSALVQKRALRGNSYTLENPLSSGRDAVISIYSASQLSAIGDLSGLKVGMADFSKAVKLSSLKVGDSTEGYDNPNLTSLTIGNLVLLRTLDVRNCSALTQAVDISGCTNIEHVYFDGTAITGVTLPNGGNIKTLHLPGTVTNLTILNQKQITDFVLPNYTNISTLRLENINNNTIDTLAIINGIQATSRVRLLGIDWAMDNVSEVFAVMDKLDTFRGLDENGNNVDKAVVGGRIYVPSLTGEELDEMNERYPNITIDYDTLSVKVQFYDGDTLISDQRVVTGTAIPLPEEPTKESTVEHVYTFVGWSLDGVNVVTVVTAGTENITYYAVYNEGIRYYTVRFLDNDGTVLQEGLVAYGVVPTYEGDIPVDETNEEAAFTGWDKELVAVTGDTDYTAVYYIPPSFKYALINNDTAYSVDGIGDVTDTDIVIPNTYKGLPVTSIGYAAFKNSSLTSVIIGDNVTSIAHSAFYGCSSLTSVTIGSSVASTGPSAFYSCSSLTSVTIGDSVTSIDNESFAGCNSLTSVTIPDGVTSIGWKAFYSCRSLTSVTIGNGVTSIANEAFSSCRSLTSFIVSENNQTYKSIDGDLYTKDGSTLVLYSGGKTATSVIIPNSVTAIYRYAFASCTSLTSVTIPDSVTSIGNGAFKQCGNLTSVTIGNSVTSIGDDAFSNTKLTSVIIPNSVTSIGQSAFYFCIYCMLYDFRSHEAVPTLGWNAFSSIRGSAKIVVPDALYDSWIAATNWADYAKNIVKASEYTEA